MRRMRRTRFALAAGLLAATLALTGCASVLDRFLTRRDAPVAVETEKVTPTDAVLALGGRIVDAEVIIAWSGLAQGMSIKIVLSTADPVSVDELETVVRTARDAAGFDPVDVTVRAYVLEDGTMEFVDTMTAGAALFPEVGDYLGGIWMMHDSVESAIGSYSGD